MGSFLMMSGVAQASISQVEDALGNYAEQHSGMLASVEGESIDEGELLLMAESQQGNVTVLYPDHFTGWDDASGYLSVALGKPVFSLHVHDGDLWTYTLFVNGEAVDNFNPLPNYWEELEETAVESWPGDAAIVSRYWPEVSEEQIANYLVNWETLGDEEDGAKAYPDDEHGAGEDWQIVDFMAKLGLIYPDEDDRTQAASRYRFKVKDDDLPSNGDRT